MSGRNRRKLLRMDLVGGNTTNGLPLKYRDGKEHINSKS